MKNNSIVHMVFLIAAIHFFYGCLAQNDSFQPIEIELNDKVILDGRYYNPDQPGPGILLLCQCDPTTDQNEYTSLALKLKKSGHHVLSFDYRGYGKSGGSKASFTSMKSMEEVMEYWRNNWLEDIEIAFNTLVKMKGVDPTKMNIIGASCGNFLGLEFALKHKNLTTLSLLGGPVDDHIIDRLAHYESLPILILAGNEGPTFEWVDRIFNASKNKRTSLTKFKTVSHGTGLFSKQPHTEDIIVEWINKSTSLD